MRLFSVPTLSWALYDFANTMFSMNVVTLHFALWVTRDQGASDLEYSLTYSGSMLAVILLAPVLGRLADIRARRHLFLVLSTSACAVATAAIGLAGRAAWGLFLFFAANIGYQLALVFYDSLLPSVASPERYGRVSGLGVALGYAGAIAGIALVAPFVDVNGTVIRQRAFLPTGLFYLAFSLPCFLSVREKKETAQGPRARFLWRESFKRARERPGVRPFLLTMFLIQTAANTVILFMGIYASAVAGWDQSRLNLFFMVSALAAFGGSFACGHVSDVARPWRVLQGVLWLWMAALGLAAFGRGQAALWVAGSLIGIALGGLWATSRPLLLTLIAREEAATFFGLNVLAGRLSALVGPSVWGAITGLLEPWGALRYRIAVGALLVFVAASLAALRWVPDRRAPVEASGS